MLHVFSSVILPNLLYGLECTVLLEPEVHHLQSFVMCCPRIILSTLFRTTNTTPPCERMQSSNEYPYSYLMQTALCRTLVCMSDNHLPVICSFVLPSGKCSVGGQKYRVVVVVGSQFLSVSSVYVACQGGSQIRRNGATMPSQIWS